MSAAQQERVSDTPRKKINENTKCLMGDRVFWFSQGELTNAFPAMANLDEQSRMVSLTVFTESGTIVHRAVRHYAQQSTQREKERCGLWAWNRNPEQIVDL